MSCNFSSAYILLPVVFTRLYFIIFCFFPGMAPEWVLIPETLSNHHYKMIRTVPRLLPVELGIRDMCSLGLPTQQWPHCLTHTHWNCLSHPHSYFPSPLLSRRSLPNSLPVTLLSASVTFPHRFAVLVSHTSITDASNLCTLKGQFIEGT